MSRTRKIGVWLALVALFFVFYAYFSKEPLPERSWESFLADVKGGQVRSVTAEPDGEGFEVQPAAGARYQVRAEVDPSALATLRESGVPVRSASKTGLGALGVWIAIGAVVVVFLVVLRKARAPGVTGILGLRKTQARLISERPAVTFADVGGAAAAKAALADVVTFLKDPKRWEAAGARPPQGVLLEGRPGSGKTLLARAVAGECKASFFEVSGSEFVELFVGVGAARVRDLFEQAGKKAPAVVFIDEIDAMGRRRGGGGAAGLMHQEREQTLNQLLVCLDGFRRRKNVVVLAATNRGDILDPALLRPGRFDVHVEVPQPTEQERREILGIHLKGKPVDAAQVDALARQSEGLSGAELEHLAHEAARAAIKRTAASGSGALALLPEDFAPALAQHKARLQRLDHLDVVLADSSQHFTEPRQPVVVRATLGNGTQLRGELVWADPAYVKLKTVEQGAVVVAKASVVQLEPQPGTAPASSGDIGQRHARATPDAA